jgi:hypothetical protein
MELIQNFIGANGFQHFATLMIFALIGATVNLLTNVTNRDKESTATPYHFSFKFMLLDNWKRMVNSLLLIYLFVRFMPLLLPEKAYEAIDGDLEFVIAGLIGYSFDKLSEILKDKAALLRVNRDNIQ